MSIVETFLLVVECFCRAEGVPESTVSSRVFNDGKRLAQVRRGADIGVRRVERAMQWFSDNWPADADWPEAVARPVPQQIPEAAE